MSKLLVLREVEELTEIAKNIFGDIVHKVYYAESNYGHLTDDFECDRHFDRLIKKAENSTDSIEQDGKTIIIEFINGKKVVFYNSEWGAMEAFSDDEIDKII